MAIHLGSRDVEPATTELLRVGEYLTSERELYRVERVFADRVLIEDCRTDVMIEMPIAEVLGLRRVEPEPTRAPEATVSHRPDRRR